MSENKELKSKFQRTRTASITKINSTQAWKAKGNNKEEENKNETGPTYQQQV